MGRPFKAGVDYFPLDVVMDDKVELLEAEHGITGFGIYVKLYQKIYANNYWINWDNKSVIVFSSRINVDIKSVNAIINSCIEWGIFDKKLFEEFNILTSRGIQKRFFEITKRRKEIEIINEYLTVDLPENTGTKWVTVYINPVNESKSTQSKVKQSESKEKVKKSAKEFTDDSLEMKISRYLFKVLLKSDQNNKEPNFQNWCIDVDKILRLDKRTPDDIKKVINYAHDPKNANDKFSWIPNLRCPRKLREHFTTVLVNCNGSSTNDPLAKQREETRRMLDGE
jgi:uncharacterized protein DUF4373